MRFDDLVDLCLDVQAEAAARHEHLPERDRDRDRVVMRAVLRVAAARMPGIARHLEGATEAVRIDETARPRLMRRARPHIDAVLRRANLDGDVTERMLIGDHEHRSSAIPWVVSYRAELCWLLARDGMSTTEVAIVARVQQSAASKAIRRHEARLRGERAEMNGKEQVG